MIIYISSKRNESIHAQNSGKAFAMQKLYIFVRAIKKIFELYAKFFLSTTFLRYHCPSVTCKVCYYKKVTIFEVYLYFFLPDWFFWLKFHSKITWDCISLTSVSIMLAFQNIRSISQFSISVDQLTILFFVFNFSWTIF